MIELVCSVFVGRKLDIWVMRLCELLLILLRLWSDSAFTLFLLCLNSISPFSKSTLWRTTFESILKIVFGSYFFFSKISPSFYNLSYIFCFSLNVSKYLLTFDLVIFSKKYPNKLGCMSIIIAFILCWWLIILSLVINLLFLKAFYFSWT